MASRNPLGAKRQGVIKKCPKFDFGITQNIGIGGSARLVFPQEFGEYPIFRPISTPNRASASLTFHSMFQPQTEN